MNIINVIEQEQLRADIPAFRAGDTVRVHVKVVEGTRERIQVLKAWLLTVKAVAFVKLSLFVVLLPVWV